MSSTDDKTIAEAIEAKSNASSDALNNVITTAVLAAVNAAVTAAVKAAIPTAAGTTLATDTDTASTAQPSCSIDKHHQICEQVVNLYHESDRAFSYMENLYANADDGLDMDDTHELFQIMEQMNRSVRKIYALTKGCNRSLKDESKTPKDDESDIDDSGNKRKKQRKQ